MIRSENNDMSKTKKDKIQITLKYSGNDVNDGTMSVEDIVPALEGLSSVYGKITNLYEPGSQHKLRITAVNKGSFEVVIEVWNKLGEISPQLQGGAVVGGVAFGAVKMILKLMQLTKHIQKQPYTETVPAVSNTISIKNSNGNEINVPIQVFTLYKEGAVAGDLAKVVKPLQEDKIDKAEIFAESQDEQLHESVTVHEKSYFEDNEIVATKTDVMWLQGTFNSLYKSTNKGFFILSNGNRVAYKLVAEHPENLYEYFIYPGLVRVRCIAELDENLKPILLEIDDVEKVQMDIFDVNDAEDETV